MLLVPVQTNASAAFTPDQISGLVFWVIPDISTMWQDTGATTPVASDADPVGRWDDQSGNANHVTGVNTYPTYRVNIENSLPMLLGSGGGALVSTVLDDYFQGDDTPITVAAVIKKTGNTGEDHAIGASDTFSFNDFFLIGTNGTSYRVSKDSAGSTVTVDAGTSDTSSHVMIMRHNGTTVDMWIDGSQIMTASASNAGSVACTRFCMFASVRSFNTAHWEGYIGEALVYSTAISNADVTNLQAYLADEWAL